MTTATVFNIQRFSVHDGPGVRSTVFLKGCPLRCAWCHNPESGDARPQLAFRPDRCLRCGACAEACPEGIAGPVDADTAFAHDHERCRGCGACAEACPTGARELLGRASTVDEVLAEVLADRPYYEASGGGVTLSGGEPLSAANELFTIKLIGRCRDEGLHVAVDTCGLVERDVLMAAGGLADLVLFDLKLMDPQRHHVLTRGDVAPILDNLYALSESGADVWLRVPLVPGVNDGTENLEALAELVASLPFSHPVHLLPYHAVAREKYARLGLPYELTAVEPPAAAAVDEAADRLREHGLRVRIGG